MARDENLLHLRGVFASRVEHQFIGVIEAGTISFEYFWPDRWYNVFRFHGAGGDLMYFYCNINMPPVVSDRRLDFVDLDIDIVIRPDGSVQVLDEDEFAAASVRFGYSPEIVEKVKEARSEILQLLENREFPFDVPELMQLRAPGNV